MTRIKGVIYKETGGKLRRDIKSRQQGSKLRMKDCDVRMKGRMGKRGKQLGYDRREIMSLYEKYFINTGSKSNIGKVEFRKEGSRNKNKMRR